jgi:hypothetical protein
LALARPMKVGGAELAGLFPSGNCYKYVECVVFVVYVDVVWDVCWVVGVYGETAVVGVWDGGDDRFLVAIGA